MNEIHRYNGTIKYNIRELERDKVLSRISDEEIEKKMANFQQQNFGFKVA